MPNILEYHFFCCEEDEAVKARVSVCIYIPYSKLVAKELQIDFPKHMRVWPFPTKTCLDAQKNLPRAGPR